MQRNAVLCRVPSVKSEHSLKQRAAVRSSERLCSKPAAQLRTEQGPCDTATPAK
ncbi:hypothetical protein P7K49_012228, partial [Saguinus oedipus]